MHLQITLFCSWTTVAAPHCDDPTLLIPEARREARHLFSTYPPVQVPEDHTINTHKMLGSLIQPHRGHSLAPAIPRVNRFGGYFKAADLHPMASVYLGRPVIKALLSLLIALSEDAKVL
jgi:hypothetical protein